MKTCNKSVGFKMSPTNTVPAITITNNQANYGKTMIDVHGRSYVQTPHGKIY